MITATIEQLFLKAAYYSRATRGHKIYLFRDNDIPLYIGQSVNPFVRIYSHLAYKGPTASNIGNLVLQNHEVSPNWIVEFRRLAECHEIVAEHSDRLLTFRHVLQRPQGYKNPTAMNIAEAALIQHYRPCLNAAHNPAPHPLPGSYWYNPDTQSFAEHKGFFSRIRIIREPIYRSPVRIGITSNEVACFCGDGEHLIPSTTPFKLEVERQLLVENNRRNLTQQEAGRELLSVYEPILDPERGWVRRVKHCVEDKNRHRFTVEEEEIVLRFWHLDHERNSIFIMVDKEWYEALGTLDIDDLVEAFRAQGLLVYVD